MSVPRLDGYSRDLKGDDRDLDLAAEAAKDAIHQRVRGDGVIALMSEDEYKTLLTNAVARFLNAVSYFDDTPSKGEA